MGVLTKGLRLLICSIFLCATFAASAQSDRLAESVSFEIPAQSLEGALLELSKQSSFQIVFSSGSLPDRRTSRVSGRMPIKRALDLLLRGTDLGYKVVGERTLTVILNGVAAPVASPNSMGLGTYQRGAIGNSNIHLAQAGPGEQAPEESPRSSQARIELGEITVVPEILVLGSRILNMDIRRSRDDAQPYVTFDRETIKNSGAVDVNEFLRARLPMNTVASANTESFAVNGDTSQINLRGLGASQTLILIDGRRASGAFTGSSAFPQPNLNGTPLSAIERIEVLPTTASGIYGGGATGGVVNVVLRRDYVGLESRVTYDNSFEADSSIRTVDLGAGFSLKGGRTNVLLAANYSDAHGLSVQDREFVQRGRAAILRNNAAFLLNSNNPPLGTTPNIRSVNGSPLFGPSTANFTSVPAGYTGGGGLAPLQANAGTYNLGLAESALTPDGGKAGLLNGPTRKSGMTTIRREFTDSLQGFIELAASDSESAYPANGLGSLFTVAATAPNNPFGQDIRVMVPSGTADSSLEVENQNRRVVTGAILRLPGRWSAELDYAWSRSRYSRVSPSGDTVAAANAVRVGTLDVLRDTRINPVNFAPYALENPSSPSKSTVKDVTLRAAGPVLSLPAGTLRASALLEHRDELFGEIFLFDTRPGATGTYAPDRSQSVDSVYLETTIPVIRDLELQLAGRLDDYTVKGATNNITIGSTAPVVRVENHNRSINPTIGLRYQPARDVLVRASYGTGFLPPSTNQLIPGNVVNSTGAGLVDPRRGGAPTGPLQIRPGGNPNLDPEESESWSAGIVLTPRFLSGLRVSVDYTKIEKTDNIATFSTQVYIDNESAFEGRIVRDPPAPGDPFGVGRITFVDATSVNISKLEVEAYDIAVDYRLPTERFGEFDAFAVAARQTHHLTRSVPGAPLVENVGVTSNFPLKLRANAGVTWKHGGWTLGYAAQYFHSYLVANPTLASSAVTIQNQGSLRIPRQTYHDVFGAYRFQTAGSRLLAGLEIQAGIRNLFDEAPPFDASNAYFYSPFAGPRMASYYVSAAKQF